MIEPIEFVERPHCDLCGCEQPTILLSKAFTDPVIWDFIEGYYAGRVDIALLEDAKYELAQCPVCGFMWQRHILNGAGMKVLYDHWISAEDSLQKKHNSRQEAGFLRQAKLIKMFTPHKTTTDIHVLDFGMGWGYWCLAAQKIGYSVVGMEIAETRLAFARQQHIESVASFDELNNQSFDFINAEQVFEHIPKPLDTLTLLAARLAQGGILRIAVPNGRLIPNEVLKPDWKASKNAAHPLEHINTFTHSTLARLGETVGLSVVAQPIMWSQFREGQVLFRSIAASLYRRFFGTVLFFRKQ